VLQDIAHNSIGLVETQYYVFPQEAGEFRLSSGQILPEVTLAYETYGRLNHAGDNAILILTGFSADAHAAGRSKGDPERIGWWDSMIGPAKAFDTNRYFVICSNVLGGCYGSTGPSSLDPATGTPYASRFPTITMQDIINAQHKLICWLGVKSLAAVSGASMGGMQALQWLVSYPDMVRGAIPIACSAKLTALALGINEVCRAAILADPDWRGGEYYGKSKPKSGLAVARMAAHLTYVSAVYLESEFGRRRIENSGESSRDLGTFDIQGYLRDEGERFSKRFDANTFLTLFQAIEQFDLNVHEGGLEGAFAATTGRVFLLSFSTDWLFPPYQIAEIEEALRQVGAPVSHISVETPFGHDAFLTDWTKIDPLVRAFLDARP